MNEILSECFGPETSASTAVAIGAFDGVHLGHQHILRETVEYAKRNGLKATVMLFNPLPAEFFGKIDRNQRILLPSEQVEIIQSFGIENVIIIPFSQAVADMAPEEFISDMQSRLHCERLFMGEDFSIGKNRLGSPERLTELGKIYGFTTEIIPKDCSEGNVISSTRIRGLLNDGEVSAANRLLGYPFFFSGEIIHGRARGRKLGFPTLNLQIPDGKIRLPNGVYAVNITMNGKRYPSVTNIGVRPTFEPDATQVYVESFLLDASGDFYGQIAKAEFISHLRAEERFASADDLRVQVEKDILTAKEILM